MSVQNLLCPGRDESSWQEHAVRFVMFSDASASSAGTAETNQESRSLTNLTSRQARTGSGATMSTCGQQGLGSRSGLVQGGVWGVTRRFPADSIAAHALAQGTRSGVFAWLGFVAAPWPGETTEIG